MGTSVSRFFTKKCRIERLKYLRSRCKMYYVGYFRRDLGDFSHYTLGLEKLTPILALDPYTAVERFRLKVLNDSDKSLIHIPHVIVEKDRSSIVCYETGMCYKENHSGTYSTNFKSTYYYRCKHKH